MARPARPERTRSARSSRQLSRFYHSINPDRVFGTHKLSSVGKVLHESVPHGLKALADVPVNFAASSNSHRRDLPRLCMSFASQMPLGPEPSIPNIRSTLCPDFDHDSRSRPTSHKRIVAQCIVDGDDISKEMVCSGQAVDWPKFSAGYFRCQK
jgi:hypothetical protein